MEGRGKAKGVESCSGGRSMTDQGRAEGIREPGGVSGMTGHGGERPKGANGSEAGV